MWKWVLESRLQASDFQGNETHIHIPEWENTSPWDRAIEQLVRLSPCTMCPLRTEPGQGWGQVAGRCCHLKGWGMPEPEGRMAASKGTEQLKAREKNQTLKYWSFHLQVRVKQRLSVTKSGGKKKKTTTLITWSCQVTTVGNQFRARIGRCLNYNMSWIHTFAKKHVWMLRH